MKKLVNRLKKLLNFFALSTFIMSISFLLMPLATSYSDKNNNKIMLIIVGLVFWISLLICVISILLANKLRKKILSNIKNTKENQKKGIFTFFSNKYALVFDLLMFISLISFAIVIAKRKQNEYIAYIILSVLIFSFSMHCMLNGKIYKLSKQKLKE